MLLGRKTRHGRPSPAASASEAHDPEPPPLKQADPYGAGWMPAGHARPGNESHSPPAWATARTHRMDRAASAPGRELDARKTRAPGRAWRTAASMPAAQPTCTGVRAGTSGSTRRSARSEAAPGARDPTDAHNRRRT